MSIQAPNLDSRSFDDLIREAKERIPQYSPSWSNFNPSDPGMTLVELHAYMTETLLYELNRVPELNYIKFLELLNIQGAPAHPALTELTFTLDKLDKPDDPLQVPVPLGAVIAVDDPNLTQDIVFETDRTLIATNAQIAAAFVHSEEIGQKRKLITKYEKAESEWLHTFKAFSDTAEKHETIYFGLLLRPVLKEDIIRYTEDAFPKGTLEIFTDSLNVFDQSPENTDEIFSGPMAHKCTNSSDFDQSSHLRWQVFTGETHSDLFADDKNDTGWTNISLSRDNSSELTQSGNIGLEIPPNATAINPSLLSQAFWESFGQTRPPQSQDELITLLNDPDFDLLSGLGDLWEKIGVSVDPDINGKVDLDEIAACGENREDVIDKIQSFSYDTDPSALSVEDWESIASELIPSFPIAEGNFRDLYWVRARIQTPYEEGEIKPQPIRAFRLNTVEATQAVSRLDEQLGRSNGSPSQSFKLAKTPILIHPGSGAPDIELAVSTSAGEEIWERVSDFYNSKPDSRHYTISSETGVIQFGDGRRGNIPVADARITAKKYRYGGGAIGNVKQDTITKIRGNIRNVKSVTNHRSAHDGNDAELVEDVKLRAPHTLRARDRAVSSEDFRDLAMRTPGINLHKTFAISRAAVDEAGDIISKDGSVTLVILPKDDHETPQPSNRQLQAVCQWLEPKRLITTELHVTGPKYAKISSFSVKIIAQENFDLSDITSKAYDAVLNFLHPIKGGRNGTGWVFGEDIYHADIYDVILSVEGVRRVFQLKLDIEIGSSSNLDDITKIADGYLPHLSRDIIDLAVSYG